jgi:hypothetical protein
MQIYFTFLNSSGRLKLKKYMWEFFFYYSFIVLNSSLYLAATLSRSSIYIYIFIQSWSGLRYYTHLLSLKSMMNKRHHIQSWSGLRSLPIVIVVWKLHQRHWHPRISCFMAMYFACDCNIYEGIMLIN